MALRDTTAHEYFLNLMARKQDAADAEFVAAIANDYDPEGYRQHCEEHDHSFFTYCVRCPEDTANGKTSDAARAAATAALLADCEDLPF